VAAGASVKTNLAFFTKGNQTRQIWYYDLSSLKVAKKRPLTATDFEDFFARLPKREDSLRSWTVTRSQIEARGYDLKAVNPNVTEEEDKRTPSELLDIIDSKQKEIAALVAELRSE